MRLLHRSPAVLPVLCAGLRRSSIALGVTLLLAACAPEIGSEAWCKAIGEKNPGDITANEAADYARHCLLR